VDTYGVLALVLLGVGLALLVAEVFLPSGGILGVATTTMLVGSVICAYAAWYRESPGVFFGFCGLVMVTIPGTLGGALYILPRTPMGKRVILEAPDLENLEPHAAETARLKSLVGRFGSAVTMLNPGGMVQVDGKRLHAFSEGVMVDPGESIEVLEVRGTRVLVRRGMPPEVDETAAARDPMRIDFDLPRE
jgi:membrane-bound serine protease (ClpP class)